MYAHPLAVVAKTVGCAFHFHLVGGEIVTRGLSNITDLYLRTDAPMARLLTVVIRLGRERLFNNSARARVIIGRRLITRIR